jgi:hypothetical protein
MTSLTDLRHLDHHSPSAAQPNFVIDGGWCLGTADRNAGFGGLCATRTHKPPNLLGGGACSYDRPQPLFMTGPSNSG